MKTAEDFQREKLNDEAATICLMPIANHNLCRVNDVFRHSTSFEQVFEDVNYM